MELVAGGKILGIKPNDQQNDDTYIIQIIIYIFLINVGLHLCLYDGEVVIRYLDVPYLALFFTPENCN